MIYLIQAGEAGPVKIGVARNPLYRMRELQTGQAETLFLVDEIDAPHANERFMHEELKEFRIRGEWFRPVLEVFEVFERCKTNPRRIVGLCESDGSGVSPRKQRWAREKYNAYQREYMRKRRGK